MTRNTVEDVEAKVIDTELASADFALDLSTIQSDVADLERSVKDAIQSMRQLEADQAAIDNMEYSVAKNFEQSLNKCIQDCESRRKKLKADFSQPMNEAEAKYQAVMQPVRSLHSAYKERRQAAEDAEKLEKKNALKAYYEDLAPFLALPLEGQSKALVPFERIFNTRWLNRTMGIKKCEAEIDKQVIEIQDMEETFDNMRGIRHRFEAKAAMFDALSLEAALKRNQDLCEQDEREEALEKARAEQRDRLYETTVDVPPHKEALSQNVRKWRLVIDATDEQKSKLIETLKSLGIHGTIAEVKGVDDAR